MAQDTQGKTAIVTGAGSGRHTPISIACGDTDKGYPTGINLEFARLLLQHGSNVLFADLALRPEAQELVDQYQSKPKAVFQKTDVTSWADLNDMFKVAMQHFGSVDIVCPGAGVFEPKWSAFWYPPGSAETVDDPLGGRYKMIDINLTHPIRVTQLAISHFLNASPPASPQNPKSIVHIASIAAQTASAAFPLYHVSKHGVQALVRSMGSLEGLCGIRVTGVNPGVVKTPLFLEHPDKLQVVDTEQDAWVTPQRVAEVMLACVKDDSVSDVVEEGSGEKANTVTIKGGSCIEVLTRKVRDVPLWNNVGPYADAAAGATASNSMVLFDQIRDQLKPGWGQTSGSQSG